MKAKIQKCCICGKTIIGYGHNPDPVEKSGRCCDDCNLRYVVAARIALHISKNK